MGRYYKKPNKTEDERILLGAVSSAVIHCAREIFDDNDSMAKIYLELLEESNYYDADNYDPIELADAIKLKQIKIDNIIRVYEYDLLTLLMRISFNLIKEPENINDLSTLRLMFKLGLNTNCKS